MPGLRPLQGPHVLGINCIVPRLHLQDKEVTRMMGLHLCPDLLLIQRLPTLDNLGTRVPWVWHRTYSFKGKPAAPSRCSLANDTPKNTRKPATVAATRVTSA
jgi:hypothetical protein